MTATIRVNRAPVLETVQNLRGYAAVRNEQQAHRLAVLRPHAHSRALADADLVHLHGVISPGQFHQNPPLISPPVCCHRARP